MTRRFALLFVAGAFAACNQNTINTPTRSFDRPSDFALNCVEGNPNDTLVYDVHPMSDCTPDSIGTYGQWGPATFLSPHPNELDALGNRLVYAPQLRGVVANSARGELALVDVTNARLVDLSAGIPGFNFLPVGKLPEHVRISPDGCRALTSNADSCDLATIDMATLHNMTRVGRILDGGIPDQGELPDNSAIRMPGYGDDVVHRLQPTVNHVPLGARPRWVEFAPESRDAVRGYESGDKTRPGLPEGLPGQCLSGKAADGTAYGTYFAWVALPSCQLVVEVDLNSTTDAEVVRAVRVTQSGAEIVTDLSTLPGSCPADCDGIPAIGGPLVNPDFPDAGTRLGATQGQPGALAIDVENSTGRLIIGDLAGERIDIVPMDPLTGELGAPRALHLDPGALGVNVVRVSPRSQAGKFLYAVARDATVRVIDLDREVECETNPDPRATFGNPVTPLLGNPPVDPAPGARALGCFPLGDPSTPPRSPLNTSPGIQLPNNALPKDVAFTHIDVPLSAAANVAPLSAGPSTLVGDFAFIISSDGRAAVVTVFDACPQPNDPQLIGSTGNYTPACDLSSAEPSRDNDFSQYPGHPQPLNLDRVSHRLRNASSRFYNTLSSPQDNIGMARLQNENDAQPFQLSVGGVPREANLPTAESPSPSPTPSPVAVPNTSATAPLPTLQATPIFSNDKTKLQATVMNPNGVGTTVTDVLHYLEFVDPDHARSEAWTLAWEGPLPGTTRNLGRVAYEIDSDAGGKTGRLLDAGAAFCNRGVLRGDKLYFNGCTLDTDCDYTQSCAHDPLATSDIIVGMCLPRDNQKTWIDTCGPLLRAQRRYRVISAKQGTPVAADATSGVSDELRFVEIYEPEHNLETLQDCVFDVDCNEVNIPNPAEPDKPLPTRCLPDWDSTGQKKVTRCLRTCDDGGDANSTRCGDGFQCTETPRNGHHMCVRAPLETLSHPDDFLRYCMPELQAYEVHVSDAFAAVGALSGLFVDEQANPVTRECEVPPVSSEHTRLYQSRIPVFGSRADEAKRPADFCPPALRGDSDTALDPSVDPLAPLDPASENRNACLLVNWPDRIIHYENPLFALALKLPAGGVVPPDVFTLSFNVVGGGFASSVALAIDVQAQQPVAAVTGPDRQTVFIVDEGKQTVATGLRGQLLKLVTSILQIDHLFIVR